MARKGKHSILIYGPEGAAKRTAESLKKKIEKAEVDPAARQQWEEAYIRGLEKYAANPERVKATEEKLTAWYEVLMTTVAPKFAEEMARAKAEYYRELARKMRGEKTAEEAEKEYEKIFKPI